MTDETARGEGREPPVSEETLEDRVHKEGKVISSAPVKGLTNEIDRLRKLERKLRGQVERRGKHIDLLQSKLYSWNEAVIEGAKLAGYSLKFDDPDHEFSTGWPPGVYPSHVEKLLQHVLTTKNQVINGFLAERVSYRGREEDQENEINKLHKYLVGLTRALQEIREALDTGPVGDVVEAARQARGAQRREIKEKGNFIVGVSVPDGEKNIPPGVYTMGLDPTEPVCPTKPSDEEGDKIRLKLTLLIQTLVKHEGECWVRTTDGRDILQARSCCGPCNVALEAWEPCPYCFGKKEGCRKCIKYLVLGWAERKK